MTTSFLLNFFMMITILSMMIMIISSILMNFIHPLMLILILVLYTIMNLLLMFFFTAMSMYMYMYNMMSGFLLSNTRLIRLKYSVLLLLHNNVIANFPRATLT